MTEQFAPHTRDPVITPSEVAAVAAGLGIPGAVLIACCGTESSFDPMQLTRYEPGYENWLRRRVVLKESEYRPRSTSWGIGHVMGQTLREMQYGRPFEELLTDHNQAAHWSGRFLKRQYARAMALPLWTMAFDAANSERLAKRKPPLCHQRGVLDLWEAAIGAYNTGGFTSFPQKHIERFRWWRERAHRFGFPE